MLDQLSDLLVSLTASPWVLLVVVTVCLIDGFFPPVPSETTVVAAFAAALAAGHEIGWTIGIVAAAAIGAVVGDSIAFAVGSRLGLQRFRWMRTPRVRRATGWIARRMQTSPATLVLVGRYIPVGRVAVNAMAGASGLPYRRFVRLAAVAGALWALMCVAIAGLSAAWLGDPVLAALLAITVMLGLGGCIDLISRRRLRAVA